METTAQPTNGQSQLIPHEIEVPLLDFSQPTTTVTRKVGGDLFSVTFRRRSIGDYKERDKAINRESEQLARDEWEERGQDKPGDIVLFDLTVESGERRKAEGDLIRAYSREDCLKFTGTEKHKFIRKLLRIKTEVLSLTNEGDPMFDSEGEVIMRQLFGNPGQPDHVVDYTLIKPLQGVRDAYEGCTRLRTKRKGDKPIFRLITDPAKVYEIGTSLFSSMKGAIGNVNEIDPYCVLEYTAQLMIELDKEDESF